jgi:tetratricopeptide (TPR) repeat protein
MRARFLIAGVCWVLSAPIALQAAPWQQDSGSNQQQSADSKQSKQKKADAKDAPDAPAPQAGAASAPSAPSPQPDGNAAPPAKGQGAQPAPADGQRHSTLQDNPFPEDVSKKAAEDSNGSDATPPGGDVPPEAAKPAGDADPGNAGAVGSSSRQGMGRLLTDIDKDASADGATVDTRRAKEDERVGKFYLNSGDYQAAYLRFKDATASDPTNAEAVFGLAEAARKLNKRDEAIQNYQIYLLADPDSSNAKAAKKALSEMHAPQK